MGSASSARSSWLARSACSRCARPRAWKPSGRSTRPGSGRAGKTKLALRAAAGMSRGFPDGAWLVLLASIGDPLLVTQAVFSALGVHDLSAGLSLSSLTDYLASKRLLLVLDNCEHLLDACAVLAVTLVRACPELRLLATSRQSLGVVGEVRMVVPPMS